MNPSSPDILEERKGSIASGGRASEICCEKNSVSGSVSQRACVYSGARVVLNPITDAVHIVHGPIGCASYTWDIRGSLTSGGSQYRNSFSTDLLERDIIFGGAEKLARAVREAVERYNPKLIFIYATCIVGVIGDDVDAVCREAEKEYKIRVIAVKSAGFSGSKSLGYRLACEAIMKVITPRIVQSLPRGINILGDFNLAGEIWIIEGYFKKLGIPVQAVITGDASYERLLKAPNAALNVVQCAGSMTYLAKLMEREFEIPYIKVSFFGKDDTSTALLRTAEGLKDEAAVKRAKAFITAEESALTPFDAEYRPQLEGKRAAIYVGGGFKAISLVRQFNSMGIDSVVVGTQTGQAEDYAILSNLAASDAVILDDANPAELEAFIKEKKADILVGGVKERP
ncbi:MAG: nitrogenase iron-molybdenum cofactor biosynthesis protein NifE, partial [Deferribacteraceae bacterium]|nr:nitrogenase iron-molybdenum cofactor biosynthesis protein NifE [Deferribacteraceae bacterium]